jgi:hypothetical protein
VDFDCVLALWPRLESFALGADLYDHELAARPRSALPQPPQPQPSPPPREHLHLRSLSLMRGMAPPRAWSLPRLRRLEYHVRCRPAGAPDAASGVSAAAGTRLQLRALDHYLAGASSQLKHLSLRFAPLPALSAVESVALEMLAEWDGDRGLAAGAEQGSADGPRSAPELHSSAVSALPALETAAFETTGDDPSQTECVARILRRAPALQNLPAPSYVRLWRTIRPTAATGRVRSTYHSRL